IITKNYVMMMTISLNLSMLVVHSSASKALHEMSHLALVLASHPILTYSNASKMFDEMSMVKHQEERHRAKGVLKGFSCALQQLKVLHLDTYLIVENLRLAVRRGPILDPRT
ncbi:hypothetical protein A2U01_0008764, partial [Trifolium medium]|nr:hypothetical protein [Trifolium medium]